MDERKLRIAFAKVKKEILELKSDIEDIEKTKTKPVTSSFDKQKFDSFVKNVENELNSLTLITKELEDKIEHKFNKLPKKDDSVVRLENNLQNLDAKVSDFSELVQEKINIEISSLRVEMTEEIAKIYDRVFLEIIDLKYQINADNNKNKKKSEKSAEKKDKEVEEKKVTKKAAKKSIKAPKSVKNTETTKKVSNTKTETVTEDELYQSIDDDAGKKSKLKKVMDWLFVEEEGEDDINKVKSEISDKSKKEENELY